MKQISFLVTLLIALLTSYSHGMMTEEGTPLLTVNPPTAAYHVSVEDIRLRISMLEQKQDQNAPPTAKLLIGGLASFGLGLPLLIIAQSVQHDFENTNDKMKPILEWLGGSLITIGIVSACVGGVRLASYSGAEKGIHALQSLIPPTAS
jgi:hypothetical protein